MSNIRRILIQNFRNLSHVDITPDDCVNIIFGDNGSGKTSILEAIHFLSTAKSFRTSDSLTLIKKNNTEFTTFSEITRNESHYSIGVQKSLTNRKQIRVNDSNHAKLKELAQILPSQIVTINSYKIFTEGPKARRAFLDKGLFHVDPSFQPLWSGYQSALKQRNAALKSRYNIDEVQNWNNPISEYAEAINLK